MAHSELIVMLTHNDYTVKNAHEIFEACKDSKAKFWGFKDQGLPLEQMKALFTYMKRCGKTTFLEVVEYTEKESLAGAEVALECGCDILMGTMFFESVNEFCQQNKLKYMPFIGRISGRPSILEGTAEEMIIEAERLLAKGVYGFDLLGYRHVDNASQVISDFVKGIDAPVCVAGSIDSYQRLDEINQVLPWSFTIGGAFFDNKFDGTFAEQIDKVCDYTQSAHS